MVCLDARHAKKALDMKVNKTDANDAERLAHLVRAGRTAVGAYRRTAAAIAAGSVAHRPRHTRLPASSST